MNAGSAWTHGEIIGWINSDDLYAPGALRAVGEHFARHPEVEWLIGRCPIIDRSGAVYKRWITRYKELWTMPGSPSASSWYSAGLIRPRPCPATWSAIATMPANCGVASLVPPIR